MLASAPWACVGGGGVFKKVIGVGRRVYRNHPSNPAIDRSRTVKVSPFFLFLFHLIAHVTDLFLVDGRARRGVCGAGWRHCTALSWDKSVVAAAGQPLPGPLRFWRVTSAAWMRAALSAFELPVGKLTFTLGLLKKKKYSS